MVEDPFKKYKGKYEIEVDGKTWELDIPRKQRIELESINSSNPKESGTQMREILDEIFISNYPESDEEAIKAFVTKKFNEIMEALTVAFGWATERELEEAKEKAMESNFPTTGNRG